MECLDSPFKGKACYKIRNGCKIRIFSSVLMLIYAILSPMEVYASGRVMELVKKSCLGTRGFNSLRNDDDTGLNCVGSWVQHGVNNDNSILVVVDIQKYHAGHFEFSLCQNQPSVAQEYLTSNLLRIWDASNNNSSFRYFPEGIGSQRLRIEIPTGIDCIQCVVHWKWIMANHVKRCQHNSSQVGCRSKTEFYNCADLSVEPVSDFNVNLNIADASVTAEILNNRANNNIFNVNMRYLPYYSDSKISIQKHLPLLQSGIYELRDVEPTLRKINAHSPPTPSSTEVQAHRKTFELTKQRTTIKPRKSETGVVESMFIGEQQNRPPKLNIITLNESLGIGHASAGSNEPKSLNGQPNIVLDRDFAFDAIPLSTATSSREWTEEDIGRSTRAENSLSEATAFFSKQSEMRRSKGMSSTEMEPVKVVKSVRSSRGSMLHILTPNRRRRQANLPPPPPPKLSSSSKLIDERTQNPSVGTSGLIGDQFGRISSRAQKQFITQQDFVQDAGLPGTSDTLSGEALGEFGLTSTGTGSKIVPPREVISSSLALQSVNLHAYSNEPIGSEILQGNLNDAMSMEALGVPAGGASIDAANVHPSSISKPKIPKPPKQSTAELRAAIADAPSISSAVLGTKMGTGPADLVGASYISELNEGRSNQAETSTAAKHGSTIVDIIDQERFGPTGTQVEYLARSSGTSIGETSADTQAEVRSATLNFARYGPQPTAEQILTGNTGFRHSTDNMDTTNLEPVGSSADSAVPGILSTILGGQTKVTDASIDPAVRKTREELIRQLGEAMGVIGNGKALPSLITKSSDPSTAESLNSNKQAVQAQNDAAKKIIDGIAVSIGNNGSAKAIIDEKRPIAQDSTNKTRKSSQNNGGNLQKKLQDFQGSVLETVGTSSQQATKNASSHKGQPMDLTDLGMPGITLEEMMTVLNMEQQFGAGESTSQTSGSIPSTNNIKRTQAGAQMNDLSNTKSASVGIINTAELSTFDKNVSQKPITNMAGKRNDLNSPADTEANMFEAVDSTINAADRQPFDRTVGMGNTSIYANMNSAGRSINANVIGFQTHDITGVDSAGISQSQSRQIDNTQTLSNMLMDMLSGINTENTASSISQTTLSAGIPSSNGQVENRANQALAKMNRHDGNSLILNSDTASSTITDKRSPMNANIQSMQELTSFLSSPAVASATRNAHDKNIKLSESAYPSSKPTVSPHQHLFGLQPEAMLTDATNMQQSLNTGAMSQADIDSMMSMFSSGQMNLNDLEQYLNPANFERARQKTISDSMHAAVNVSSSTSVLPTESLTSDNVKYSSTNINSTVSKSSAAANRPATYMTDKSELVTASILGSPNPNSNTDPEAIANLMNPAGRALDDAGTISLADLLAGRYTGETSQQNSAMSSNNLPAENTEGMLANVVGPQTRNAPTAMSNTQLGQVDQGTDFNRVSSRSGTSSTGQDHWNLNPGQLATSGELHGQITPINKAQTTPVGAQSPQHIPAVSLKAHSPMDLTVFSPLPTTDPLVFKSKTASKSLEINPTLEKMSPDSIQTDITSTDRSNASYVDRTMFEKDSSVLSRNLVDTQLMNGQQLSLPIKNTSADISSKMQMPIMLQKAVDDKIPVLSIMTENASQSTSVLNLKPTGSTLFYDTRPKDTTPANPAVIPIIDNTISLGIAHLQEQRLPKPEKQTRTEMQQLMDKHREEISLMEQQKKEHLRQLNEAKQQIEYEKQQLVLQKQQLEVEALRKEQLQQRRVLDEQRKQIEQERLRLEQERILAAQAAKLKAAEEERRRTTELEAERQRLTAAETERIKQEQARIRATEELERRRAAETEQARLIAEQSSKVRAEEEAILRQEHLAKIRIKEEARLKAEEHVRLKAEEESRLRAEEQARQEAASASAAAAVVAAINSKASSVDTRNKINDIGQNQTDSSFTPIGAIGGTESQNADLATAAAWQAYLMASQAQSQRGSTTSNKDAGTQSSALQTILQTNGLSPMQILNPGAVPQQSAVQSDLALHAMPAGFGTLGLDASSLMQLLQQQQKQMTAAPAGTTPKPEPPKRRIPVRPDPQTREHVLNMFLNNMGTGVNPLSILIGLTPEMLMKSGVNPLIANSGDLSKIVPAVERALGISLNAIPAVPGQMPGPAGSLTPLAMGDLGLSGGAPHERVQARRQQMLQQRMLNEMMQFMSMGPDPLEPGDPGYRGTGAAAGRSAIGMRGSMTGGGLGGEVGGPSGAGTNQFDMMGTI